jgi:hypothetical protein
VSKYLPQILQCIITVGLSLTYRFSYFECCQFAEQPDKKLAL